MKAIISSRERVAPWVSRRLGGVSFSANEAIGLEHENALIAGVVYENWNGASFVCHIAVQGLMTPAYLAAIFYYPFIHCGAKKIIAPVAQSNAESVRFVTKLGFREEARLLDAHPDGSLRLYTMTPEQCRFIGERYGQRIFIHPAATASA